MVASYSVVCVCGLCKFILEAGLGMCYLLYSEVKLYT